MPGPRRGSYRWIPAVLAFAVALFFLFPQTRNRPLSLIELPFVWASGQVTRAIDGSFAWVEGLWLGYVDLRGVREQNGELAQQRDLLLQELASLREAAESANRLEVLLGFENTTRQNQVASRIIGTDTTRWFEAVMIDRGTSAGVAVGDGVISPQGAVGRVAMVTHHTAQVVAIHNRGSVVPVRIQRTRQAGILEGGVRRSVLPAAGPGELPLPADPEALAEVKFMYRNADVAVGDRVVTSGLGGWFPPGLPAGEVVRVIRDETEPFAKVYVTPQVRLDTLEEVLVVRHNVPGSTP